jgi:hypothetical protein
LIFHPDPGHFIESSAEYGPLGNTMVALSNLEFAHDTFVFTMYDKYRNLSLDISNRFPRHYREKTDFLVYSVANVRELKKIPVFSTGELNLLWLQYQLDELYMLRTMIAHGSVFYSESTEDRITWTFERYVQKSKRTWATEAVEISNGFLASVHLSAELVKFYLYSLIQCLDGVSCWEKDYQADKEVRKNRIFLSELVSLGVIVDEHGWISGLAPLGPVE